MPLIKWFLAIPHYFVLFFLSIGVFFAAIGAWFAILFTGRYPRGIFKFIEGTIPLAQPGRGLCPCACHRRVPALPARSLFF